MELQVSLQTPATSWLSGRRFEEIEKKLFLKLEGLSKMDIESEGGVLFRKTSNSAMALKIADEAQTQAELLERGKSE